MQLDKKLEHQNKYNEIKKRCWLVFAGICYNFFLFIFFVNINFLWLFGTIPDVENVENPQSEQASEIYAADNVLLGKYFRENRSPVSYENISPNVINALVSTEDLRFEEHSGVDLKGVFAIFYYAAKGNQRGSSTITQQLAKNLFKTRKNSSVGILSYIPGVKILVSKTKEWITAIKLERAYTKKEIIELYLNTVDFGSGSYGIKTAARTYFNTSADSLTVPQAATMIGLLKATTSYSPIINPNSSIERRNVVMRLMVESKKISQDQYVRYAKQPIGLTFKIEDHNDGSATYFRGVLSKWLLQWCKEHDKDLYGDGLKDRKSVV